MKKEIDIPKGYTAEIKDGKIVFIKESGIKDKTPYWYIDIFNEKGRGYWLNSCENDKKHLACGNLYLSEEECDKQIAINQAVANIKRYVRENGLEFKPNWEDRTQQKIRFHYDYDLSRFFILTNGSLKGFLLIPYFASVAHAQQVIANCREDLDVLRDNL